MRPDKFDKEGQPLSLEEWMYLFEDMAYRRIGHDEVNGRSISTVWLGLDHSFGSGPPLIFETMVFPEDSAPDGDQCERYSTLEEARTGHAAWVEKVSGWPAIATETSRVISTRSATEFGTERDTSG